MFALYVASECPAWALKVFERTLPNGVKMIVSPDSSLKLAAVDVWVRAGTAFEDTSEIGAAHFLEHVLFKGTPSRPSGKIDEEIESLGATLNASTSRDWAHFYTTVAAEYLDSALTVLADALQHPLFDPRDVDREKQVVQSEIESRRLDPDQVLEDAVASALYGSHPYGTPPYGQPDRVASLTPGILRFFHKTHYVGPAMTVIVVGNVDTEETFKKLKAHFSSVPSASKTEDWPAVPSVPTEPVVVEIPKIAGDSEYMGIGFLGPSMKAPKDVWAMDVLTNILVRKGTGVLWDRLVNQDKVAVDVGTSFLTTYLPAMVSITVAANKGKLDIAEGALKDEINRIRLKGVTPEQMNIAKHYLLGIYAFEVETAGGQAASFGFYSVIGDLKDSVDYQKNIQSVTTDDVQRVAYQYLDQTKMVTVRSSK